MISGRLFRPPASPASRAYASVATVLSSRTLPPVPRTTIDSPLGPIELVSLDGRRLAGVYLPNHARRPSLPEPADAPVLQEAARQLREYFDRQRTTFELPLDLDGGTAWQRSVWAVLATIPHGAVRSYGEIAKELDAPGAGRAVGNANARNPVSIVLPCHRVVGSGGATTGYAGGTGAKTWLLSHESPSLFS